MIDGAYGQVKGLMDLSEKLTEITYAYTIGSLDCDGLLDNVQEHGELMAEIRKLSKEEAIEKQVQKAFAEFKARRLESHTRECLENKKIIQETEETVKVLWEIIENEEKLEKAIASIGERLKEYFSKLADTNELARYKQGKLAIDVAAMFIGAGEVNGARKIITFEEYLVKAGKADVEKVVAELGERGKKVEGVGDEVVEGADHLVKKIPDEVLAEIERIKELRRTDPQKRIEELGRDLDKAGIVLSEGRAGFEIEQDYGYFKRYKTNSEKKGDWISLSGEYSGKTFDEIGGEIDKLALTEISRVAKKKRQFFQSIDNHFNNADYVVLNLSEMKKLDQLFYNETLEYILNKFGDAKLINITQ